jgi:hypothetical protein
MAEENNKPTATIIQTSDGMNLVKYSDGSIQTGTVEQLTESLSSSYNVVTQESDYIGMDIIGEHQLEYADQIAQMNESGQQSFGAQQQASYADSIETGFTPDRPDELTFDPDSAVGQGRSGFLGLKGDKASYVILSDGTRIQSTQGNTASEIADANRIAQIYVDRRNAAISAWDKLYGNIGSVVDDNTETQIAALIQSYNHYVQTGQDDGGGFINAETGLPTGAANEAEAFLMRTGNYVMSRDTMLGILDNASDGLKESLSAGYFFDDPTLDAWSQTRERIADNFLGAIGTISDNRNFGMLLAVSAYSSDAFVNAVGVANVQSYQVGQPNFNAETGEFLGYNRGNVNFSMVNGQPIMTGVAGNTSSLTSQTLSSLFVDPTQIQGIVQGNVFSNYQKYYNDYRKGFEFLNNYDFLNLKALENKIIPNTSGLDVAPGSGGMGAQDFTGLDQSVDYSGLNSGIGTAQTFSTSGSAPVTYDTQQVQQTFDTSQPALGSAATGTSSQAPVSGTFNLPSQTANLSAVPQTITTQTDYTGTNMANLTSASQGVGGVQQVVYQNPATDQQIRMTEINGSPIGVIPPGFQKVTSAAQGAYIQGYESGGLVEAEKTMAAKFLGFNGTDLEKFLEANPAAAAKMGKYRTALRNKMTQKGTVFAQSGTFVDAANQLSGVSGLSAPGDPYQQKLAAMQRGAIQQTMQPLQSNVQMLVPQAADFTPTGAGQAYPIAPFAQSATVPSTAQAGMPMTQPATFMVSGATSPQVQAQTGALQAVEGEVSEQANIDAAQQLQTSVSGIEAAQGTATMINNPVQRQIQDGEIVSGAANAETASKFAEQIQAATATPTKKATVAGQLEDLMADFEGGETPAWAAGSMRTAMATLSARGLGASSLAGQAVVQAAMEAALPIAQMDAQVQAQFEGQNLSNRQQRAMLAAQQRASFIGQEFDQAFQARVANASRIGDIANMNFNADQQIALENARASNTMSLSNLTNSQAMVMAEAAALSQLDMANLNNRQQAAVQNAQNFLQMDMTNLSNEQQTAMFKTQQNVNAILTDTAAGNAAAQFNATSDNQTKQFFSSLTSQVSQFNSTQQNAMDQFNVNSVNALREFNSELQQQRDLFNAQNGLVVSQSNAQWRQNIATMNTAALNESNATYARTINGLTETNMGQIWQRERDIMSFAFQTANNNADRATSIAVQNLQNEATKDEAAAAKSASFAKAAGTIIGAIIGK